MNALRLASRNVHQAARLNVQGKNDMEIIDQIKTRGFQSSSLLLTGKSHDATDGNFEELVGAKEPIIVDFHADWCRPCHVLDPIIRDEVKQSGAVTLIRVNVDECPKVASEFQIASVPCVMAFKGGKPVDKFVGALPKNAVKDFVEKHAGRA